MFLEGNVNNSIRIWAFRVIEAKSWKTMASSSCMRVVGMAHVITDMHILF